MRMLCGYHEALRAFWNGKQLVARDQTCLNLVRVDETDLRHSTDINGDMLPYLEKLQSTIDLAKGPLVHAGLFHLPEYDAVFLAIHHLVVDGVSWRIITEDLNSIYPQLLTGSCRVKLPKIRCSFADYAEAVHKYAVSDELFKEMPYWTEVSEEIREITKNIPARSGRSGAISFKIEKDVSQEVLMNCVSKYGVEVNDLLLTALSRAWKKVTGQNRIALSMEGHGREAFGDNPPELDRIVGWFTIIYPALIDCSIEDIAAQVKQTAATMHSIPNKGFGYGTLLNIAHKGELDCSPTMAFNYLGSFEEGGSSGNFFTIDNELPKGSDVSSLNIRNNVPLSINCLSVQGCLTGSLGYDTGVLSEENARALMEEFSAQMALL